MNTKPFQRALHCLKRHIDSDDFPIGSRLPALIMLARQASVSLVTMWKAAGRLKSEGVLQSAGRKGTIIVRKTAIISSLGAAPGAQQTFVWQNITTRIESDLLSGSLGRTGILPSAKQLRARYGVNPRTLRKSLRALAGAGVLVAYGRTFRLAAHPAPSHSGEVLVFIYGEHEELSLKHLDAGLLRAIESFCHQSGLRPTFVRYWRNGASISYVNYRTHAPWTGPAGMLLGCLWLVLFDHEVLEECCRRLLGLSCPVAVLDDTGKKEYPPFFREHQRVKFFTGVGKGAAGEAIGRLLIILGHRRCAYISTHFAEGWSISNHTGLARAYEKIGAAGAVQRFVVDAPGTGIRLSDVHDFSRIITQTHERAIIPPGMSQSDLRVHYARTISPVAGHSMYLWRIACDMKPLMQRALRDRAITAWVCGDDEEAVAALDFLKRKSIEVPQRISVAGFNSSLDALKNNLTSYGDNYEAIIHAMIDFVVRPNVLGSARRKKTIMIDGFLVERGTTGPARIL